MTGPLAEDGMDKAATDRIEQQVRLAFPDGAIARVQVLQYGDDPEVEPGQAAIRLTLVSVRRPATGYPPANAQPGPDPPSYSGTVAPRTNRHTTSAI